MDTHHAYLLFADSLETSAVPQEYKKSDIDVHHVVVARLSIGDARDLTLVTQQGPLQSDRRAFVIVTTDIAIEAQNALLKLFEEPPVYAQFFLVVPKTAFLLPTLRSRLMLLEEQSEAPEHNTTLLSFLKLTYGERIALIGEKTKVRDQVWIDELISESEKQYATDPIQNVRLLKVLLLIRTYIHTRGASPKMLLEELAVSLPGG